jgi:type IV pilus secretin PilQ/predicted competence protein
MKKIRLLLLIIVLFLPYGFSLAQGEGVVTGQIPPVKEEKTSPVGKMETLPDPTKKEGISAPVIKPVIKIKKIEDNLFAIELRDVEIGDLLRVLAHDYKLNIIINGEVKGKVTASFTNISLEEALEKIAENNNLMLKKTGNVIKVMPNLVSRTFVLKYISAKSVMEGSIEGENQTQTTTGSTTGSTSTSSGSQPAVPQSSPTQQPSTGPATPEAGSTTKNQANKIFDLLSDKGRIFFDNAANSIIVIDYPHNLGQVEEYLGKIDIIPRQVLIEARIVEVKLQKEHSLGVNWSLFAKRGGMPLGPFTLTSTVGGPSGAILESIPYKTTYYPPGQTVSGTEETPFTVTLFNDNISVILKMLANQLDTTVLSAPRVTTINNSEAEIKMIQRIPWAEPQVSLIGESTTSVTVTWDINFEEVGITLKATPTINEDGTITMKLDPNVSEKTADYTLRVQQGTTSIPYTVPIIDTRSAATKVVVGNGQTLIIGGLIKDKTTKGETKVPFFGDLPYLGHFFKSTKNTGDKTELLIFVSPTLITQNEFKQMAKSEKYGIGKDYMQERERQEQIIKDLASQEKARKDKVEKIKREKE